MDIAPAAPGWLLDYVQKAIDVSDLEIVVLDEADCMRDMGFIPDIRRIMARLSAQWQILMFSAFFSDPVRELASGY